MAVMATAAGPMRAWRARGPRLMLLLLSVALTLQWRPQLASTGGEEGGQPMVPVAKSVMAKVRALQAQAKDGGSVPNLAEKAQQLVAEAKSCSPVLAQAVSAALEPLFLRQLRDLRSHAASETHSDLEAAEKTQSEFLEAAQQLKGSQEWHMEPEAQRLRAQLDQQVDTAAALAEERARAALVQRSTIEVIGRLQEQMEELAAKAQAYRDGSSPFVLSTSYRIPKTPLQFVSRYEQGRANIMLTLTPDKDPTKSDGGFASAVGPANIGISFDVM
ncbi:unnamed protein product [Durusdinium trenchii]|uniref:Uncharacterized protein n=1 Tax=Durusdinium trenchii TaxID=1381693 RepID=A0ABP0NE32_9DINO